MNVENQTNAYRKYAMLSFIKKDRYANEYVSSGNEIDENLLKEFFESSMRVRSKVALVSFVKSLTKQGLVALKKFLSPNIKFLEFISPENITPEISDEEYVMLLEDVKNSQFKPKNVYLTIGQNMALEMFNFNLNRLTELFTTKNGEERDIQVVPSSSFETDNNDDENVDRFTFMKNIQQLDVRENNLEDTSSITELLDDEKSTESIGELLYPDYGEREAASKESVGSGEDEEDDDKDDYDNDNDDDNDEDNGDDDDDGVAVGDDYNYVVDKRLEPLHSQVDMHANNVDDYVNESDKGLNVSIPDSIEVSDIILTNNNKQLKNSETSIDSQQNNEVTSFERLETITPLNIFNLKRKREDESDVERIEENAEKETKKAKLSLDDLLKSIQLKSQPKFVESKQPKVLYE